VISIRRSGRVIAPAVVAQLCWYTFLTSMVSAWRPKEPAGPVEKLLLSSEASRPISRPLKEALLPVSTSESVARLVALAGVPLAPAVIFRNAAPICTPWHRLVISASLMVVMKTFL
jgi:hypothetical protein